MNQHHRCRRSSALCGIERTPSRPWYNSMALVEQPGLIAMQLGHYAQRVLSEQLQLFPGCTFLHINCLGPYVNRFNARQSSLIFCALVMHRCMLNLRTTHLSYFRALEIPIQHDDASAVVAELWCNSSHDAEHPVCRIQSLHVDERLAIKTRLLPYNLGRAVIMRRVHFPVPNTSRQICPPQYR